MPYREGISGGDDQPNNYVVQPTSAGDMSKTVFGGIKEGMDMSDAMLTKKIAALKQEQQAAMQQELGQVAQNPTPQALVSLSIKYPSLAKDFKTSQDMLGPIQQKARLDRMLPVHAALNAGNTDAAVKELQTQADALRNSGNEPDAKSTENMIKVIQTDPRGFNTSAGILLASVLGPDKYAENFIKIQKAPADLAKEQADTAKTQAETAKIGQPTPDKPGTFEQALNLYNQGKSTPVPATDKGFVNWYTTMAHPKAAPPGTGVPSGPSGGDPNAALSKLSSNDQAIVKQLASRQLMVGRQGGFQLNNPRNQGLYGLAIQLNPSLSVVDNAAYQDFVKDLAKSSPTSAGGRVDAGNRLLGHSADLIDALGDLNPGSGASGRVGNVLSYPSDKLFKSAMGKVSFIKSKMLAETNKLVTGGVPGVKELQDDIQNMPDTATKEQWGQMIKAVADIGLEQVTATEEKRSNLLGSMAPKTSLLSAKAQANLSRIYKYAGSEPPVMQGPSGSGYTKTSIDGNPAPGSGSPVITSQAAYNALPNGAAYVDAKGLPHVKGGQ